MGTEHATDEVQEVLPFSFVTDKKFIVISPLHTWIKNSNPGIGQSKSCVAIFDPGFRAAVSWIHVRFSVYFKHIYFPF